MVCVREYLTVANQADMLPVYVAWFAIRSFLNH